MQSIYRSPRRPSLQVNRDDEKECFGDFAKECSQFYAIRKQFILDAEPGEEPQVRGHTGERLVLVTYSYSV